MKKFIIVSVVFFISLVRIIDAQYTLDIKQEKSDYINYIDSYCIQDKKFFGIKFGIGQFYYIEADSFEKKINIKEGNSFIGVTVLDFAFLLIGKDSNFKIV